MDSQENVLNNEAQLEETNQQPVAEEVVKQEENVVTPEPAAEEPVVEEPAAVVEEPAAEEPQEEEPAAEEEATEETASKKVYATKKEVIERIKELAHGDESPTKEEVDLLKTTFYKLHFAEREAAQKAYLEAGGDPEKYTILPDEDEEVFKAETEIIKGITADESCVITGRSAFFVLKNNPNHLSVLIQAPMEQRIQRVMKRQDLARNMAIKVINQVDERRENYVQKFCGTSRYDTRNYDLVISMEHLKEDDAVDIIMDYIYRQSK